MNSERKRNNMQNLHEPSSEHNTENTVCCDQYDPRREMFKDFPDVVGVEGLCQMLGGIGKNLGYQLLRERKIPHIRVGRTIKIAKPDIINFVLNIESDDEFFKD